MSVHGRLWYQRKKKGPGRKEVGRLKEELIYLPYGFPLQDKHGPTPESSVHTSLSPLFRILKTEEGDKTFRQGHDAFSSEHKDYTPNRH